MKPVLLRILLWAAAAGIASAFVLAAPDPVGSASGASAAKAAAPQASGRFEMQSRAGTLKSYRAGKSVVIAEPDGRLKRLPVDPAARVDRGLVRGQQVNVISMTDETGHERVSAISRSAPAAAGNAAGSAAPPRR
ncbi:MAG TPA: hypothetical protein VKG23_16595 [Thermoanaerobaculia bacterium]|nr:hypothetical protein [Thermoanaerobaculia bacterium]